MSGIASAVLFALTSTTSTWKETGKRSRALSTMDSASSSTPRSETPCSSKEQASESDSDEEPNRRNKIRKKELDTSAGKVKNAGRKAVWQEYQITDMVSTIVNDEKILRKLVFTNTRKAYNTEAYQKVLNELNENYNKDFPFSVQQMRSKFKWCISTCKKICLTVKTAIQLLYPLVKSRDSSQPEKGCEPSAPADNEDSDDGQDDSTDRDESNQPQSKTMFVPVKKATSTKRKGITDQVAKAVELLQTTIENDPTRDLLQILKEDMQHSREEEMKFFQMMCGMMTSNPSMHGMLSQNYNPMLQSANQNTGPFQQAQYPNFDF